MNRVEPCQIRGPINKSRVCGIFNFMRKGQMRTGSSTTSKRAKRSAGDLLRVPCRALPERIRKYTIKKIIKTEFVNTSFYRFLLLYIEEKVTHPILYL